MERDIRGNILFQKGILIFLTLSTLVLILRVAQFSLRESAEWRKRCDYRIGRSLEIEPRRGKIYGSDERTILAESRIALSIAADNHAIRSTGRECLIAERMATITGEPVENMISRLHSRHHAEWLARDIHRSVFKGFLKAQCDGLLPGIHVKREIQRDYPEHPHAASLVGFVTREREHGFDTLGPYRYLSGVEGLERVYDRELSGVFGKINYRINRFQAPEHDSFVTEIPVQDGLDLVCTIDAGVQRIVREELLKAIEHNQADSALAIVMDPWTGAIIAAESVENTYEHMDFEYRQSTPMNNWPPDARRNLSMISTFEPGSTWKPVIMAIALENNLVKPSEIIPWKKATVLGRHTFYDWKDFAGDMPLRDVLKWSSNSGMIEISKRIFASLSHGEIFEQILGMGFLRPLPLDYSIQPNGMLNPVHWGPISIGAIAEGYETGVTLSQLAAFYCSIANGGYIVFPHFGKKLLDPETGNTVRDLEPQQGYPIMSSETAEFIRNALFECVECGGTGSKASMKNYRLNAAGKTGTAIIPVNGSYASKKYRASFAGFFPAQNPHYVIVVSIVNPSAEHYYGGQVAAPLFQQIAGRICSDLFGILPMPFPKEI
jgi:cell division protein FtsI/penicillin-binding protein 2